MVKSPAPAQVLWDNISALMQHHWGGENLTRLSKTAKIGQGTPPRIKSLQPNTGIDSISKIAAVFDLQAWQLLMPGLDPSNPPVASLTAQEQALYGRLKQAFDLMQNGPKNTS